MTFFWISQLLFAAQSGDIDKVYDLLQAGADPNVRDEVRTEIVFNPSRLTEKEK